MGVGYSCFWLSNQAWTRLCPSDEFSDFAQTVMLTGTRRDFSESLIFSPLRILTRTACTDSIRVRSLATRELGEISLIVGLDSRPVRSSTQQSMLSMPIFSKKFWSCSC